VQKRKLSSEDPTKMEEGMEEIKQQNESQ